MTLTKSDLAAIYRACEHCENHIQDWYANHLPFDLYTKLGNFYGSREFGNWSDCFITRQNERIMALLFFAAAGGEL